VIRLSDERVHNEFERSSVPLAERRSLTSVLII